MSGPGGERGAAAVKFALLLPLLMIILGKFTLYEDVAGDYSIGPGAPSFGVTNAGLVA